jgi:hypothetical protein
MERRKFIKLALGTTMAAPALIKASVPIEPLDNIGNDVLVDISHYRNTYIQSNIEVVYPERKR